MKKINLSKSVEYLLFVIAFAIFALTSSRSVQDYFHGEFLIAQKTLSIPHSPGFPLYVFLGWILSFIPTVDNEVLKFNLISSFYASIGIFFFFKLSKILVENLENSPIVKILNRKFDEFEINLISLASSLSLAFSTIYWTNASISNPYSLAISLTIISFYFSFKAFYNVEKENLNWFLSAIFLGLASSAHLFSIFAIIPVLYLFFTKKTFDDKNFIISVKLFSPVLIVLIIFYGFLFLISNSNPYLNYGEPNNLKNIIDFLTLRYLRKELVYQYLIFTNNVVFLIDSIEILSSVGIIVLTIGLAALIIFSKIFRIFFLTGFFVYFILLTNIYINLYIIDYNFLFIWLLFLFPISYAIIASYLAKINNYLTKAIVVVPIIILSSNFKNSNYSNDNAITTYLKAASEDIKKESILISFKPNNFYWNARYNQFSNQLKRNFAIVDPEQLCFPYYIEELSVRFSKIFPFPDSVKNEMKNIAEEFVQANKYVIPQMVETSIKNLYVLFNYLVKNNIDIYFTFDAFFEAQDLIPRIISEEYDMIPYGLLFKFDKIEEYRDYSYKDFNFNLKLTNINRTLQKDLIYTIPFMLEMRIIYETRQDKPEKVKLLYNLIKEKYSHYSFINENNIKEYLVKKGFTL